MATNISIPLNVKQVFLPFVLDKNNKLNTIAKKYSQKNQLNDDFYTQFFSFKPYSFIDNYSTKNNEVNNTSTRSYMTEAAGFLRIAPHDLYRQFEEDSNVGHRKVSNDLSYRLLYQCQTMSANSIDDKNVEEKDFSEGYEIQNLLNDIPSITIREYLQESKLNIVIDFLKNSFTALQSGFAAGSKLAEILKDSKQKTTIIKTAFDKFDFVNQVYDNFLPIFSQISTKIIVGNMEPSFFKKYSDETEKNDKAELFLNSILSFPYAIYYMIISSATMNIYEVPFSGKILYASQGGGFSKATFGGVDSKGESLLGSAVNWFGKNLRINVNPTWDGPQDTPTKVDIEFDLYNDSLDGALKNFIFVNTIVPGNKWLQYNVFQHAPNLYDIKINGIDRLFMCQGDFSIEYSGQLRRPSKKFINKLVKFHTTSAKQSNEYFGYFSSSNDNIRIPDQYKIKMTFTSLLPNNFNNFIYSYYMNTPIQTLTGDKICQDSIAEDFLDNALSAAEKITNDFYDKVKAVKNNLKTE